MARRLGALLTAAAVAIALGDDGGYSRASREHFAAAAFAALVAAAVSDWPRTRRLARTPLLWVLAALAVLGAASTAWTVGIADEAWHWGLTTGAIAALLLAAAVLVRSERDVTLAAGALCVMATGMFVVGLVGALDTITPYAHREAGRWRPASTFQYSPALALLAVSVLPPLLAGMVRARGTLLAAAAAFGGATAAAVLALAESRTQLAFAAVVGGAAIFVDRRHIPAIALLVASGVGTYAVAGGYIPKTPAPDGTERLLAVAAVIAATTVAWLGVRAALRRGAPAVAVAAALLAVGAAAAIAKPAPRIIASGIGQVHPDRPPKPRTDLHPIRDQLLHGRLEIWDAAIETFADRPLHGGGADSYVYASAPHQGPRTVLFAHSLPLELAAELGIAGLLLALGFYGTAGVALWRARRAPGAWLVLPAAVAFLCANLVDWPWHLAGTAGVWAFATGALLGVSATQRGH